MQAGLIKGPAGHELPAKTISQGLHEQIVFAPPLQKKTTRCVGMEKIFGDVWEPCNTEP